MFLDSHDKRNLREFVRSTGVPLKTVAEATGLTKMSVLQWWHGKGIRIRERHLYRLARYFAVDPQSIMDRTYDLNLVRRRLLEGAPQVLPGRYGEHAYSHICTSAHILEYLALTYGRKPVDDMLIKMNVHPLYFENSENKISLAFFKDLLDEVSMRGFREIKVWKLAQFLPISLAESSLRESFSGIETHTDFYEVLFQNFHLLEENFNYSCRRERDRLVIKISPSESLLEAYGGQIPLSFQLSDYRKAAIECFPTMIDLAPLPLFELKSLHAGDGYFLYYGRLDRLANKGGGVRLVV